MLLDISILNCDLNNIESFLDMIDTDHTILHMDIMDKIFVPQSSFDETIVKRCSNHNKDFIIDTHLMVEDVESYIERFKDTGSSYITFHLETSKTKERIDLIHKYNIKAGLSIKPSTDVLDLIPYLKDVEQILVMSVEPGLGGQKFMPSAIDKVKFLYDYKIKNNLNYKINIDGGINLETINYIKDYCDMVVVGSAITKADNIKEAFNKFKNVVKEKVMD